MLKSFIRFLPVNQKMKKEPKSCFCAFLNKRKYYLIFSVLLSILIKEMNDRMMLGPWFVFEERLHFLVGMSWTVSSLHPLGSKNHN